jgi:hypothetical protein
MDEAALIALVRRAISCHETTGCLEYASEKLQIRIRRDPQLLLIGTPRRIKEIMVQHVISGGSVEFRKEKREEYQNRRECWFRVKVPVPGFPQPLFCELELTNEDPDYPSVLILNVHF